MPASTRSTTPSTSAPSAAPDPQEVIAALKRHGTVIDPTLALYELLARPLNQPIDAFEPGSGRSRASSRRR